MSFLSLNSRHHTSGKQFSFPERCTASPPPSPTRSNNQQQHHTPPPQQQQHFHNHSKNDITASYDNNGINNNNNNNYSTNRNGNLNDSNEDEGGDGGSGGDNKSHISPRRKQLPFGVQCVCHQTQQHNNFRWVIERKKRRTSALCSTLHWLVG